MEINKNDMSDIGQFGKDWVFVLEKMSDAKVELKSKDNGDYILEGVAAVFGKENQNRRIYEEKEYLPHLDYLQKKISKKKLLGELDHPAGFDTSLKNASHIVEKLEYDKDNRTIKIRLKLINGHPSGEMAKALINAGYPLSISSRAAGVVKSNKLVEIKKIFTYDLVADGGFGDEAELERMYESVMTNFSEDKNSIVSNLEDITKNLNYEKTENIKIYRVNENNENSFLKALELPEKNNISEMNKEFVTVDELHGYSQIIKKEMDALKEKIKTPEGETTSPLTAVLEERMNKIEKYMAYIAENLDKNIEYAEYIGENLDQTIEYSKYLAESVDKVISYGDYLAENVDKSISYGNYLAETLDKNITYANYLAENLEKGILYGEYLAENIDKSITYGNYLAETLDKNINYSEYVAKKVDESISYGNYLAETLDKNITYAEYVAEKLEKNIAYAEYIAENVNTGVVATPSKTDEKPATEVNEKIENTDYKDITKKVNSLLETVKNQKAASTLNESKYNFYKLLNENKRKEFTSLEETKKEKVIKALENGAYFSEMDVIRKWDAALTEQEAPQEPKFIQQMPDKVKPIWESMSVQEKEEIYAKSKSYKLDTAYQIKNFWSIRLNKEKPVGLIKLNENESAANAAKPSTVGYNNAHMAGVADELAKRFKK